MSYNIINKQLPNLLKALVLKYENQILRQVSAVFFFSKQLGKSFGTSSNTRIINI